MRKGKAIELLGGTPRSAASAIGVSASAVSQWPDPLPKRVEDRVLAAIARKHLPPELLGAEQGGEGEPDPATPELEAARSE